MQKHTLKFVSLLLILWWLHCKFDSWFAELDIYITRRIRNNLKEKKCKCLIQDDQHEWQWWLTQLAMIFPTWAMFATNERFGLLLFISIWLRHYNMVLVGDKNFVILLGSSPNNCLRSSRVSLSAPFLFVNRPSVRRPVSSQAPRCLL